MNNVTALIVTAIVTTIGIIKFKLIEELVKKITPDNQKAKGYAICLLAIVVVILTAVSLSLDESPDSDSAEVAMPETKASTMTSKSDLEVKVDAVKDGVALTEKLVGQAKEKKRVRDSTFNAARQERWVYQIGDWTKDDDKILDMHKQLLSLQNIKMIRQGKNYLFIKEDLLSRKELENSIDEFKQNLNGISVSLMDMNRLLTRRKDRFITRIESFGRRKNKIELECLVAN
jgi:hypothetical protein